MQKAVYCTFITIGEDGQPQARIVDPTLPDSNLTIWIGTNSLTRKVNHIRRDPQGHVAVFSRRLGQLRHRDWPRRACDRRRRERASLENELGALLPERIPRQRFHADPCDANTTGNLEPLAKNDERPEDVVACCDRLALI